MDLMLKRFNPTITAEKAQTVYRQRKESNTTWAEHLGMLLYVSGLMQDNGQYVVENLVRYAKPSLTTSLLPHYDIMRTDYKQMAEEIPTYAEAYDNARSLDHDQELGRSHAEPSTKIKDVKIDIFRREGFEPREERRRCYNCQRHGHIGRDCPEPSRKGNGRGRSTGRAIFAILHDDHVKKSSGPIEWVIDTGAEKHLTYRMDLLSNVKNNSLTCVLPNGATFETTHVGDMELKTQVNGQEVDLLIKNVHYRKDLSVNLLSHTLMDASGYFIVKTTGRCAIRRDSTDEIIMELKK